MQLKLAQDTLLAPAKRFAYERFGPAAVTQWQHCATVRDFVVTGVQATLPYYVGGMLLLMVLSTLGYGEEGRYVSISLSPSPNLCYNRQSPTTFHSLSSAPFTHLLQHLFQH